MILSRGMPRRLQLLHALVWREAQTQTFADAFLAVMVCLAIATVMVPLMRKVVPPKAPAGRGALTTRQAGRAAHPAASTP